MSILYGLHLQRNTARGVITSHLILAVTLYRASFRHPIPQTTTLTPSWAVSSLCMLTLLTMHLLYTFEIRILFVLDIDRVPHFFFFFFIFVFSYNKCNILCRLRYRPFFIAVAHRRLGLTSNSNIR